jgi:hypothetical protein
MKLLSTCAETTSALQYRRSLAKLVTGRLRRKLREFFSGLHFLTLFVLPGRGLLRQQLPNISTCARQHVLLLLLPLVYFLLRASRHPAIAVADTLLGTGLHSAVTPIIWAG